MGNYLVELGTGDEIYDLLFTEAEIGIERFFQGLRSAADGTDSVAILGTEFVPTSKAVS